MPNTDNTGPAVVAAADEVHEVKSEAVSEAKLRHDFAQTDYATPQEKRQAAVELANAAPSRPDGSDAQLHAAEEPTVFVADEARLAELKKDQDEALGNLEGSPPAGSPAGVKQEEAAAKARKAAADKASAADRPAAQGK